MIDRDQEVIFWFGNFGLQGVFVVVQQRYDAPKKNAKSIEPRRANNNEVEGIFTFLMLFNIFDLLLIKKRLKVEI